MQIENQGNWPTRANLKTVLKTVGAICAFVSALCSKSTKSQL